MQNIPLCAVVADVDRCGGPFLPLFEVAEGLGGLLDGEDPDDCLGFSATEVIFIYIFWFFPFDNNYVAANTLLNKSTR